MKAFSIFLTVLLVHIVVLTYVGDVAAGIISDSSPGQTSDKGPPLMNHSRENGNNTNFVISQNHDSRFFRTNSKKIAIFDTGTIRNIVSSPDDEPSCRLKCGQIRKFPCSCDLRCLVHKNCCEDMEEVCPEVLEESRLRYGHMLDMKVECPREEVFVITECGDVRSTSLPSHITASINNKISSSSTEVAGPTENSININDLLDAIKNPYVTDTTTGFVYKNMEIFSCAALDNSSPVTWGVVISGEIMYTITSIEELLSNAKYVLYSPPTSITSRGGACSFASIGTCDDAFSKTGLPYKCQKFISYVQVSELLFNNKYCKLCNFNNHSSINSPRTQFKFSLTMTLSGNSLQLAPVFAPLLAPVYWESATCEMPTPSPTYESYATGNCKSRCFKFNVKAPNGSCVQVIPILIAVSDDEYPLTVDDYNAFPEFAGCFLRMFMQLYKESEFNPTVTFFDDTHNIKLYATQIYMNDSITVTKIRDEFLQNVSLMSKTFKAYRRSRSNVSKKLGFQNNTVSHQRVNLPVLRSQLGSLVFGHPSRVVTNSQDTTIACLLIGKYEPFSKVFDVNDQLPCGAAPQFAGDTEAISRYLDSTCFSVFDLHNSGGMFKYNAMFIYSICIICKLL